MRNKFLLLVGDRVKGVAFLTVEEIDLRIEADLKYILYGQEYI